MKYKAHTVGAVSLACGIIYLNKKSGVELSSLIFIGGAVLGGLLPDIDHPKSFLGNVIVPLSAIIKATVGHRTLTHSLLFTAIIGMMISIFNITLGFGIAVGMISHIVLDLLTPKSKGVAFLYPFYKRRIKIW